MAPPSPDRGRQSRQRQAHQSSTAQPTAPSTTRSGLPAETPSPSAPTAPATNPSPIRTRSSSGPKLRARSSSSPTSPERSQQPAWSPDGKSIAFLFVENATRHAGALDAMPPWNGVIGEDGVEIQRVYAVNAADGAGHWLTPDRLHVYEFSWAPRLDRDRLHRRQSSRRKQLVGRQALRSAPSQEAIPASSWIQSPSAGALHGLQIAVPRWSPDGKRLSFIGGLMSDQGSTGGDVWIINADGKHLFDATPNIDGTPTYAIWTGNNTLGFIEDRRGHTLIVDWDADKHSLLPDGKSISAKSPSLAAPSRTPSPIRPANGGTVAFVKSSFSAQPEVWTLDSHNDLHQLTHVNAGRTPPPYKFESIEWQNEGFHVQGWLTYPKDYDPSKKYPMIVEVHGGPSASAGPRGGAQWAELGYFVFQPNPRGSFGQGESIRPGQPQGLRLRRSSRHPHGHGCHREAKSRSTDRRIGLTGWSYGGFMSMFADDPDQPLSRHRCRRRHLRLAELLRRELHRPMDDPVLRRQRLRRSSRLRQVLGHRLHQERQNPNADHRRRPRRRMPRTAELRDVACTARSKASRPSSWSIPTKAMALPTPNTSATGRNARCAGLRRTCQPANNVARRLQPDCGQLSNSGGWPLCFSSFPAPHLTIPVLPICSRTVQPLNWRLESFRS